MVKMLKINQKQQNTTTFQCKIKHLKKVSNKITTQERNNLINPAQNAGASEWRELKKILELLINKLSQ